MRFRYDEHSSNSAGQGGQSTRPRRALYESQLTQAQGCAPPPPRWRASCAKTTVFARGTLGRAGARIQRFIKEVTGESAGGGQGAQPTAADTCGNLFCRGRNVPRETEQMSLGH